MKTLIYTILTIIFLSACQKEDISTDKMISLYSIKITNHSKTIDKATLIVKFPNDSNYFVNDTTYFHCIIDNVLVDSIKQFGDMIPFNKSRLLITSFDKFKVGFNKANIWYFCKDWIDSNIPDYIISPETIWISDKTGETFIVKD